MANGKVPDGQAPWKAPITGTAMANLAMLALFSPGMKESTQLHPCMLLKTPQTMVVQSMVKLCG